MSKVSLEGKWLICSSLLVLGYFVRHYQSDDCIWNLNVCKFNSTKVNACPCLFPLRQEEIVKSSCILKIKSPVSSLFFKKLYVLQSLQTFKKVYYILL